MPYILFGGRFNTISSPSYDFKGVYGTLREARRAWDEARYRDDWGEIFLSKGNTFEMAAHTVYDDEQDRSYWHIDRQQCKDLDVTCVVCGQHDIHAHLVKPDA